MNMHFKGSNNKIFFRFANGLEHIIPIRTFIFVMLFIASLQFTCNQSSTPANTAQHCNYVEQGYGPEGTVDVRAETVVSGLEVPWAIAFLPEGHLLVTERSGSVRLVRNYTDDAVLAEEPVATVNTAPSSEGGLLGIALHPDFEDNRYFYLYVTVLDGISSMNQVEQWQLSDNATNANRIKVIYEGIDGARFHDGGRLAFGPDEMLYVGTGDATDPNKSQDPDSPNGKVLRLTPDGNIPEDNPMPNNPVFIHGIRNTQGWDWPNPNESETVWLVDHGPSGEMGRTGHDEVNVAKANDNLGWPTIYGCELQGELVAPVLTWKNAVPPGGAAVYTGDMIPEWKGSFIIGTLESEHLHRAVIENGILSSHEVYFQGELGRLREVIMGPDGHLYITTSNCDGRGNCPSEGDKILRIVK